MKIINCRIKSANNPQSDFPLNNLPYGAFSTGSDMPRCCVAIGDSLLDLSVLFDAAVFPDLPENVFAQATLNTFMGTGETNWSYVRKQLIELLNAESKIDVSKSKAVEDARHLQSEVIMHMPFTVGDFTDFYAGRQHATNVGTMFRGAENALPPNWLHIPIGYNGRASTIVVSGTDIHRPLGQMKPPTAELPYFGPCKRLDLELEIGAVVGMPNEMGKPVTVKEADDMIFGYVLLNDWSARDIQAWEYQPLGPFQAKVFATSVSPWVVTKEALAAFRVSTPTRDVELLPYLQEQEPLLYDIDLAVHIQPHGADKPTTISNTNYQNLYYSAAQQLAHHAIGGCKMNTGDLLGSGTISGDTDNAYGSLLEISWGGKNPLILDTGETRSFLEDGDTLTLTGAAIGDGYRIGFGECTGKILPSPEFNP
ncbi:MAG: fumarylacetoacetase [Granulosicoccaceae bacterium]